MFFVYVDWTTEETPRPFYVGKGNELRIRQLQRNKKHSAIVKNYGFHREIVLMTSVEQITFAHEIKLIAEHRTFVHDNPDRWGANFTRGGEGSSGYVPTKETRRKISTSKTGVHRSEKFYEKFREIAIRIGKDKDIQQRKSEALKGHKKSEATRQRMRESAKCRPPQSLETRQKRSEAMKLAWAEGRKR